MEINIKEYKKLFKIAKRDFKYNDNDAVIYASEILAEEMAELSNFDTFDFSILLREIGYAINKGRIVKSAKFEIVDECLEIELN